MKDYEIMAIVKNSLDKKAAEKFCQEALIERIKKFKGTISFEDFWGERGFAYKIKQMTWGYYFVARFQIDPATLNEIKTELNIEKDLVRFLITTVTKNTTAPRKYSDMKTEYEAQEKELMKEKEITPKKENVKPAKLTTVEPKDKKAETKAEVKEEAPKKDALDKKLDDIVSESSQDL
jgi:ribosomal protein S6